MSHPKIAIITAVWDDDNSFKDPLIVHPNVDYIAFVGTKRDTVVWRQQRLIRFSSQSYRRNLLLPIVLPQLFCANHDFYILIDPKQTVVVDPFELVEKYLSGTPLGLFAHRKHQCIFDVSELEWHGVKSILEERDFYESEGLPKHFGFYDLSLVMMRNTPTMLKMCLKWWEHICGFSSTPELSLPYILWTLGIKPSILPGYISEEMTVLGNSGIIKVRKG